MMVPTKSSKQSLRLPQSSVVFSLESSPSSLISSELLDQEPVSSSPSPSSTAFTKILSRKKPAREKPKAVKNDYHLPI